MKHSRLLLILIVIFVVSTTESAGKDLFRIGIQSDPAESPRFNKNEQALLEEVIRAFAEQEDLKLEFIGLPESRFQHWFELGSIDFRLPDHPRLSASENPLLFYSKPIIGVCEQIRVLSKNLFMTMSEVEVLGALHNTPIPPPWQRQIKAGITQVKYTDSVAELVSDLINEKIDATLVKNGPLVQQLQRMGVAEGTVVEAKAIPAVVSSIRMSSEEFPAMLKRFDDYIQTHQAFIAQIARSYDVDTGHSCAKREQPPHSLSTE